MNKFSSVLRRDALTFANQAHVELHKCQLDDDMYLRLLAYDVEEIALGHLRKYACNLPPGFGKTFLLSVTLVAWILGHIPSARILIISYGEDAAIIISKKIRAILRSEWYRKAFPKTMLQRGHQEARDFATTAGGNVYARSIGGSTTGIRCDFLIIDDPAQIRDSANLSHLEWVNTQYDTELATRLNNRLSGSIVIVHHRLNRIDLTGHVTRRHGWHHRVLPLTAPHDQDYRLKNGVWQRKQGEVLRPNAYTPEIIAELRENTAAPGFGPLYQQSFEGPDVLQIRREDFIIQPFHVPPAVPYVLSIDPNHKGEVGQSYGVIQVLGLLANGAYLVQDQWRGRAHRSLFAEQIRIMRTKYRPRVILIEDNGPALDLQAQFETSACPVILLQPHGDKLFRLRRHIDLFRNGKIVLRAGAPFIDELIAEFVEFPYGAHDDQVDTATQFFEWILANDLPPILPRLPVMGALSSVRKAREKLYWNAGRPSGPYVFSRR